MAGRILSAFRQGAKMMPAFGAAVCGIVGDWFGIVLVRMDTARAAQAG